MRVNALRWIPAVAVGIISFSVPPLSAQDSQILWSAFAAGFGESTSTNTVVTTAVGQPLVGATGDGNSGITSGFLADTTFSGPLTAIEEDPSEPLPGAYELEQNYPNPFNPTTRIRFALPQSSRVRLTIYDLLGREIVELIHENRAAGTHTIEWNGFDAGGERVSSGIYFYRIETEGFVQTRKLMLLK